MKNIQRKVLFMAAVLALALTGGCSKEEAEEPLHITLMNGWGGITDDHIAMQAIYRDFERENTDILLDRNTFFDLDVVIKKANDRISTGMMPNIVSTNGRRALVENALLRGYALDLMPYIREDPEFAACIPQAVYDNWEKDGALYTIPDVLEVSGYWYNKDIFEKAGIRRTPDTWEEFWEDCDRIEQWGRESGMGVVPVVMDQGQSTVAFLGARIAGDSEAGTRMYQEGLLNPDDRIFQQALREVSRLYGYSDYPLTQKGENDALDAFNSGRAAMYFNGVWANSFLAEDIPAAPANYPGYGGKRVSYVSASAGYVIGNTEGKERADAAVRFLKYMVSDEVQKRILLETKQVPVNPHVDISSAGEQVPLLSQALEIAYAADIQISTMKTVWDENVVNSIEDNVMDYTNGSLSLQEYTRRIKAALP